MPIQYLRRLSGRDRSADANRQLALFLAFNAGAANAGGFLAVHQYTSHMSGIVSAMADDLALGNLALLLAGLGALLSFLSGAATSAILINWGRRRTLQSEYALALLLEALLLLLFGALGTEAQAHRWLFVPATVALLCFIMGLQNAMITKISRSEIRTTHVTGLVTDIGIELGKMIYLDTHVVADWPRLRLLAALLFLFFSGGVVGALGFSHAGFGAIIPFAVGLSMLALVPVMDDLQQWWRARR